MSVPPLFVVQLYEGEKRGKKKWEAQHVLLRDEAKRNNAPVVSINETFFYAVDRF